MKRIKCNCCGKFIGNSDFQSDTVIINFTPDTHFSSEKIEYIHNKCKLK